MPYFSLNFDAGQEQQFSSVHNNDQL